MTAPMLVAERPEGPLALPEPPLSDGVVTLDELTEEDLDDIVASADDPVAARWLPLPSPYTRDDAAAFLALTREVRESGASLELSVRDTATGRHLGSIGTHFGRCRAGEAEIGYLIGPRARGRGVARRAVRLLVPWVFASYGPRRIELLIQPGNTASQRVAEAAGARPEGLRRAGIGVAPTREVHDALVYAFTLPAPDAG